MNREEKTAAVEEIAAQIEAAESIFAIDYRGISVPQAAELRARLRDADASFRIVKNRLTKLAAEKAGRDQLTELLEGPTALTFVHGDMALAAKAIVTLDRDWEVLEFKGGLADGEMLDPDQFKAIARLPGREALDAQMAGVVASPITGLVRGLNSMLAGLAGQLQQIAEQGLVSGEAESSEKPAPAEEAPTESAEEPAPAEEQPQAEEVEEAPGEGPAADQEAAEAPPEEAPTESSAEAEPQPDTPSQAEGEDETSDQDSNQEESE